MRTARILFLLIVALFACETSKAQNPRFKSLNDTTIVRFFSGGYVKEGKLNLVASPNYAALDINDKRDVLNTIADDFPDMDITIYVGGQQREVWMASDAGVILMEQWSNDDLQLEKYKPLELKRNGNSKVFYYVGGVYSKNDDYITGSLNLRGGTYLYKNIVDVSLSLGIGYTGMQEESQFTGNIGFDSRYYLPFRPKTISLTPYAGVGMAWTYAPEKYFELRLLAGVCWFVGPGSLDVGVQYGTQSGFLFTIGYTFRP